MLISRLVTHRLGRWSLCLFVGALLSSNALAASKMKAADKVPPSILHAPMSAAIAGSPVRVEARFNDPSGVLAPSLVWRLSGQKAWTTVEMNQVRGDLYEVSIAASAVTGDFEYYLEAFDNLGNGPARAGSPEYPIAVTLQKDAPAAAAVIQTPAVAAPALEQQAAAVAVAPVPAPAPAAGPAPIVLAVTPAPTAPASRPMRVLPMVVAAGGAALLAGGLVAYMDASSTATVINSRSTTGTSLSEKDHADALAAQQKGLIGSSLAIAGGVVAAGGLGWFIVPLVTTNGAGAAAGVGSTF